MNYKVFFTSNWGINHNLFMDYLRRQTPGFNGTWDNITMVNNQNEADFIIVQDGSDQSIIDMKKVIFFGREPKHIKYYCWNKDECYKVYHHENNNCWLPQTWWIGLNYDKLANLEYNKTKNFSIIDSGKTMKSGHKDRLNFINKLIAKYPNDVELFGKINGRLLSERDKSEALLDFKYSLAVENGITDNYFSEKFVDPILCLTLPIYHGCNKIDKYFPKGSFYKIDINKKDSIDELYEVINSDYAIENLDAIKEARDLILKKYNIWSTVKLAIEDKHNNLLI
jgi:hypothetical protein